MHSPKVIVNWFSLLIFFWVLNAIDYHENFFLFCSIFWILIECPGSAIVSLLIVQLNMLNLYSCNLGFDAHLIIFSLFHFVNCSSLSRRWIHWLKWFVHLCFITLAFVRRTEVLGSISRLNSKFSQNLCIHHNTFSVTYTSKKILSCNDGHCRLSFSILDHFILYSLEYDM